MAEFVLHLSYDPAQMFDFDRCAHFFSLHILLLLLLFMCYKYFSTFISSAPAVFVEKEEKINRLGFCAGECNSVWVAWVQIGTISFVSLQNETVNSLVTLTDQSTDNRKPLSGKIVLKSNDFFLYMHVMVLLYRLNEI